jgi:hypothetical protein
MSTLDIRGCMSNQQWPEPSTLEENPLTNPHTSDNLDLASRAQKLADDASTGSLGQVAAKSVAITCATTRDLAEARDTLGGVSPDEVRQAALELFDRLSAQAK